MRAYLAVGHGVEPNGVYDPGATNGPVQEHSLNTAVCTVAAQALVRSGVDFVWESNAGAGHDPDYRGSVAAINAGGYNLAVEVHFDSANAGSGGFGIYVSPDGKRLADLIHGHYAAAGLPVKPNYQDVRGLYLLHASKCVALIWECDRTQAESADFIAKAGEALAHGMCDFMGATYHAPGSAPPGPAPAPPHGPLTKDARSLIACRAHRGYWIVSADGGVFGFGEAGGLFHGSLGGQPLSAKIVAGDATADDGGYWLIGQDGGVFAFGNAGFFGSAVPAHPQPIVDAGSTPSGNGYWLLASDGAIYSYGDAAFYGGAN